MVVVGGLTLLEVGLVVDGLGVGRYGRKGGGKELGKGTCR